MLQLAVGKSRCLDFVGSAISIGLAINVMAEAPNFDTIAMLYISFHLLTALLFLIRNPPLVRSSVWHSYLVAMISTIYVYSYDLSTDAASDLAGGTILIGAGGIFGIISLVSLGKCFGVFPICRGIKTSGLYLIVRHPLYASYIMMDIGLIVSYPSQWNGLMLLLGISIFVWRIHYEELLLQTLPGYPTYMSSVRFRLLPFVY